MVQRFVRTPMPVAQPQPRRRTMSDRLKEYAAQAAIGTGINLVGGVGEKIVSNLF